MRNKQYKSLNYNGKKIIRLEIRKLIILTIFISISLFILSNFAKVVWNREEVTLFTFSEKQFQDEEEKDALNGYEHMIIASLSSNSFMVDFVNNSNGNKVFYQKLKDYLNRDDINLGKKEYDDVIELLKKLNSSLYFKNQGGVTHLAILSKGVLTTVEQEIYKKCGLILTFDLSGNIYSIKEKNGVVIYQTSHPRAEKRVRWNILIGVLSISTILIIVNWIISKAYLFRKGRSYHGYKEKKYA